MLRFLTLRPPKSKTIDHVRAEVQARNERIGREVAADLTRGNVAVRRGDFLTKGDLAARKRRPR